MTDYSRGYAAGLKAAAEVCRNVISDYGSGAADIVLANIERLPIEGDAEGAGPCVVVPVEPTEKMIDAMHKADRDFSNNCFHGQGHLSRAEFVYHAMLAAAKEEHDAHR